VLDLARPRIMGILNVTPNSFSDGGRYFNAARALEHARRMIEDGADLVDIGGESTRPGAQPVDEAEELARVIPLVTALVAQPLRNSTMQILSGDQDSTGGGIRSFQLRLVPVGVIPGVDGFTTALTAPALEFINIRNGTGVENKIVLLPLYPQLSTTTTRSSMREWLRHARDKELTAQNREVQYLRAENSRLTAQNQELVQQAALLRAKLAESGTAAEEKNPNGELTEGRQRSFSYTVKKGDTIWDIAKMYNIEGQALMRWNHLNPRSQIFPGDTLTIMLKE
jgi:cell division protein FtsB